MKKVFIAAGEASGDIHGANLGRALLKLDPGILLSGSGGPRLKELCGENFTETAHLNVTGFTEVLKHLEDYRKLFKEISAKIAKTKPDVIVFIDNPGFHLRLAKQIAHLGIPMVYYICPQVWGWDKGRIRVLHRLFKKLLVVLPFEKEFYKKNGVEAIWVGHPLRDELGDTILNSPRIKYSVPGTKERPDPIIALLPGSRMNELRTLFPILLKAGVEIRKKIPGARFWVLQSDTIPGVVYRQCLRESGLDVQIVRERKYETLGSADLALVCSGTATLECAMLGLPMVIVNRSSFLSYLIIKSIIKVRYLGLPNLILDKPLVPELLQYACTPAHIAFEASELLSHPEKLERMKKALVDVAGQIGPAGASDRAAKEILELV